MFTSNSKIIKKSKEYVNELLVPLENHYYHEYSHALEVMDRAMYIGKKEWLSDEDIEILGISWLFHDTWFIIQYEKNEIFWAKIAKNFLKSVLYPNDKIKKIEKIILATDIDYEPKNIYEKIIKDADLDSLWREDFFNKSDKLKLEIETIKNIKILDPDWQHWSIVFLKKHRYFTETQKKERKEKKEKNRKILEKNLKNSTK